MTTPWAIEPIFKGETVAILAAGPSMSQALADSMRQYKCIAFKNTIAFAPWAAMLLSLDPGEQYFQAPAEFAGIKVCGCEDENTDALYIGHVSELVTIGPGHVLDIRNNGLAAIRVAAKAGAAKIILCGFNPDIHAYHSTGWPQPLHDGEPYPGLTAGLDAITAELQAQGVVVERHKAIAEEVAATSEKRSKGKGA